MMSFENRATFLARIVVLGSNIAKENVLTKR